MSSRPRQHSLSLEGELESSDLGVLCAVTASRCNPDPRHRDTTIAALREEIISEYEAESSADPGSACICPGGVALR